MASLFSVSSITADTRVSGIPHTRVSVVIELIENNDDIVTIIKTTRLSVTVTVGVVEVGVVDTRYGVSQPGADARLGAF